MNVLRWQLLPALGRVLLRLARLLGAAGYADHYCRDLALPAEPAAAQPSAEGAPAQAEAVQASAAAAAVATAAPPDMFRALQQLLQGRRDGGGAAPPLAQQRAACVQRSADLLAAYALLADAATSLCAGPAMTEPAQVGGGGPARGGTPLHWAQAPPALRRCLCLPARPCAALPLLRPRTCWRRRPTASCACWCASAGPSQTWSRCPLGWRYRCDRSAQGQACRGVLGSRRGGGGGGGCKAPGDRALEG